MRPLTLLAALLPAAALAVFPEDAYKVDYHHALLGAPQRQNSFFHRPQAASKASLLYTLTDRRQVGAVLPKDGSVVWRHQLPAAANASFLVVGDGVNSVVSGVDREIASWRAVDGRLVWKRAEGLPGDLVHLNTLDLDDGRKDILGLFDGETPVVQRIDGRTGSPVWQYTDSRYDPRDGRLLDANRDSADVPFRLSVSKTQIFCVSLSKALLKANKIKVTILDPKTGQKVDQYQLSADGDISTVQDIAHIDPKGAHPVLVWADKAIKTVKIHPLGTKVTAPFEIKSDWSDSIESFEVFSPNDLSADPHFLVQYQATEGHWADVFHVKPDKKSATIEKAYDVVRLAGRGSVSVGVADGKVYFTRVAKGAFLVLKGAENDIADRSAFNDFGMPFVDYPEPIMAVGEINARPDLKKYSTRAAIFLSSGDWVLVTNGVASWARHEQLMDIASVAFAELPRKHNLEQQLAIEGHSNVVSAYIHRVNRHIKDLSNLQIAWDAIIKKFVSAMLGSDADSSAKIASFGFNKLVVAVTKNGRIMALDAADGGKVVWSNKIDLSADEVPQITATDRGIIRVKSKSHHSVFDTATGKFLRKGGPTSKEAAAADIPYAVRDNSLVGSTSDGKSEIPVWTFTPPPGSAIHSVSARPAANPVASIGDVLGDRSVLYKYLNPNIALVSSVSANQLTLHLLDTVSGNALWTTTHADVDAAAPIPLLVSENFFSYSFTPSPASASRGPVLVHARLHESPVPDDRGPLGAARNFSSLRGADTSRALAPHVRAQAFHVPARISTLGVSQTAQGISARVLLAALPDAGALVAVPLAALDPRRPVGRDPAKAEAEEGLARYAPNLELDAKWHLSHARDVRGVRELVAAPSGMESTGLVLAFGGDVFGTRVAPSGAFDVLGAGFNRAQALLMVGALGVGVLVLGPWVKRKQNNLRWAIL